MKKRLVNLPFSMIFMFLGILVVLAVVSINPFPFHDHYLEPPHSMADFELQTANSEAFRLSDQKGKLILVFFGYTNCPDFCPTTLSKLKQVHDQLGDDVNRVLFVMISVDPERDTPAKVAAYVAQFNAEFIGLSGSLEELQPIWTEFGLVVEKRVVDNAGSYSMSHTTSVYVIDQSGDFVKIIPYDANVTDIINELVQRKK
ncbi:MAG: hypothetical protein KPEEDBHJ_00387 [Anaerolineales bacterium]|jgi:protein SCO1/2|nr:hypothetical protein [Anaerolineales bacterium]